MNDKWDLRFLELAHVIAKWSKDPSTQVGAVIVNDDRQIVSQGYNGLPSRVPDVPEILENRFEKYKYIIHAETNAILTANSSVKDCTLYTFPFLPCTNCASMVIQAGIKRVVSFQCIDDRWKERLVDSRRIFDVAGVEVVEFMIKW